MVAGSLWGGGESRKDLRGSLVYLDPRAHRERSVEVCLVADR